MYLLAAVGFSHYMFMVPLALLSIFLVLVILVQRGRGGGLTGALGGMGGQSAFGTKAGDLFTRITIVVAAIWVLLSMAALKVLNEQGSTGGLRASERGAALPATAPLTPGSRSTTGELPIDGETPAEAPANSPADAPSTTPPPAPAPASNPPAADPPTSSAPATPPAGADPAPADDAKP